VITDDGLPYTSATGVPYDRISPAKTLEQAADLIGYDSFRREQTAAREQGRYLGIGLSLYVEPIQTRGPLGSEGAILRIDPTGEITLIMGTASHGQSVETTMAQVVADVLGCKPEAIVFIQGDTAVAPWGPGTGGSKSAVIAAGAAQLVAERMRDKLLLVAGHMVYDADGNLLTTTFMDYLLPTAAEIPDVEYGHVVTPADTPAGSRASARAGPSARRPPWSTRWRTRWPRWARASPGRRWARRRCWPRWRQRRRGSAPASGGAPRRRAGRRGWWRW
jgi:carbon-monoxide dehydrogenase large subunit